MGFFDKPEVISPGSDPGRDGGRVAQLEQRVAQLEQQVTQLQAQLTAYVGGLPGPAAATPPAWLAEVRALREGGKKFQAIKVYRERTGAGLAEAKDAVEGMA